MKKKYRIWKIIFDFTLAKKVENAIMNLSKKAELPGVYDSLLF